MAEPEVTPKIVLPAIPDGFLTKVDDELVLTQIEVGGEAVSVEAFLGIIESGMKLKEITISRDEKRAKTKFEPQTYFLSYKMNVEANQAVLDLVPEGPQRHEARKLIGRALVKRLKEIEHFLSCCLKSAQQKDGIQPYWREGQKPVF